MRRAPVVHDASASVPRAAPDAGGPVAERVDLRPGSRPRDAVDRQPAIALHAPDRGLRAGAEAAVDATGVVATRRQPLLRPPDGASVEPLRIVGLLMSASSMISQVISPTMPPTAIYPTGMSTAVSVVHGSLCHGSPAGRGRLHV
jgi:hypothetical protein